MSGVIRPSPDYTELPDGRIGWPAVVQYRITEGPLAGTAAALVDCPPNAESHPGPAQPVPLEFANTARLVAEGCIKPRRWSLAFRVVVHDQARFWELSRRGWLRDPRHTGDQPSDIVDNRAAPGP